MLSIFFADAAENLEAAELDDSRGAPPRSQALRPPVGSLNSLAVNKRAVIEKILACLVAELEMYAQSARSAHADATHDQSKAENKYDTRGLEASYLAQGQSRQAAETETARQLFESFQLRDFGPETPIDIGAVIELELRTCVVGADGERSFYFIGFRAGGTEIIHEDTTILVITPEAPLGRGVMGKRLGDSVQISISGSKRDYRIVSVW